MVYKYRTRLLVEDYNKNMELIEKGEPTETYRINNVSYDKMICMFWVWPLDKFFNTEN